MREIIEPIIHLIYTTIRMLTPGGVKTVMAETDLSKLAAKPLYDVYKTLLQILYAVAWRPVLTDPQ
jgi:hypothetical protein